MKNFKRVLSLALAALMIIGGLVIAPVDAKAEGTYTRVTDVAEITAGGNFVIVVQSGTTYYAMDTVTSGKITPVEVTITDGVLSGSDIPVWTVAPTTLGVSLAFGTDYLGYSSSTNFATGANNTDDGNQWIVVESGSDLFQFFSGKTKDADEDAKRAITYRTGTTNKWAPYSTYNLVNANEEYIFDFMVFEYSGTVVAPENIELPADATPEQIVNGAYQAIEDGVRLLDTWTLEGVITSIDTAFSATFNNISVTIQVGDMTDKLMGCYRLTVANTDDATALSELEGLAVGDTITVTGEIGSYNGKAQFSAGCILEEVEKGELPNTLPETATPEQIVNAAYDAMNNNTTMIGTYTLEGVITSIDTPYSESYGNITVTMVVGDMTDKPIQCYRLSGTGVENLKVGDTITVNGTFGNYNGKVQYNQGSTLESYVSAEEIPAKGDMAMPVALILFAGCALIAVAVISKRKMA